MSATAGGLILVAVVLVAVGVAFALAAAGGWWEFLAVPVGWALSWLVYRLLGDSPQ